MYFTNLWSINYFEYPLFCSSNMSQDQVLCSIFITGNKESKKNQRKNYVIIFLAPFNTIIFINADVFRFLQFSLQFLFMKPTRHFIHSHKYFFYTKVIQSCFFFTYTVIYFLQKNKKQNKPKQNPERKTTTTKDMRYFCKTLILPLLSPKNCIGPIKTKHTCTRV